MKKVGQFELYSMGEALDRYFGPMDTPECDAHEARVVEAVHTYEIDKAGRIRQEYFKPKRK